MIKKMIFCGLVMLSPLALGASYTSPSTITNMTVGADYSRVKIANMKAAEGCSESSWYILDFNSNATKEMYSMLLTAKVSQQKVHFKLVGFYKNYPKIDHVYNCNNESCSNLH